MTRVALLGATGSIGRQAIEVIEGSPGLELVAATSGTTPIDGLAPLTQVGGDPTQLLERAGPDVVLNATLGFAGLPGTIWALERGVTLALANKGHEVIEAHFLFGLPYERIEVVVHPTSIVHGLVRFRDGAALAHLGYPDMRVPISYALTYPERASTPVPPLDLTAGPLEFFAPDTDTFRLLALAREAGERGGTYPCVFNAANEVAVAAFLDGRIGFLEIASLVEAALGRAEGAPARDLDELREADRRARELVETVWA
jgi:1-deoxy-D-xylulose 5-phosphate reductoisomerase